MRVTPQMLSLGFPTVGVLEGSISSLWKSNMSSQGFVESKHVRRLANAMVDSLANQGADKDFPLIAYTSLILCNGLFILLLWV